MKTNRAKFSAIRMDKGQKGGEEKIAIVALLVFVLAIWIFGGWGGGGAGEGDNVFTGKSN